MSEKENFLTIKENGTGELIIKKSRFIANIARTTTTDAANDFIQKSLKNIAMLRTIPLPTRSA